MGPHEVAGHVRERLGMEIQAVSLARARPPGSQAPQVWTVMTAHGYFWLVEGAGQVELFRAVSGRGLLTDATGCPSAAKAARRFLELHPEAQRSAPGAPSAAVDGVAFDCRMCGARVTLLRRSEQAARQLCKRCRHAERERLRYHDDPQYRARRLAYSAARYRQSRQAHAEDGEAPPVAPES